MNTRLDHIVIAAADLDSGADYVNEKLGVDIPPGGRHEMMGTHNRVMSLGNDIYLEVIAINPDMDSPQCPRWFGLDDLTNGIDRCGRLKRWPAGQQMI